MLPNQVRPKAQAWATWMLALAPAMFSSLVAAKLERSWTGAMEQWGEYAFVAALLCAVLSPLGWMLLRRIPSFCVSPRTHALQVSVWFVGWVLAPVLLVVLSL